MAIFITHGIFASLFSFLWREKKTKFTVFILLFLASILPDIDFIFDEKGSGMLTHRGFTHSIFFAAVTGVVFSAFFLSVVKSFGQSLLLMLIFFLASFSHTYLDAMTEASYGVCFFCPFSDERYFFPFTLFSSYTTGVSKKGFRSGLGNSVWITLLPEILLVWIPTFAVYGITSYLGNKSLSKLSNNTYKPISSKPKEVSRPIPKKYPTQKKR